MSNEIPTITINLDAKCKRCGKGGATEGGYCMKCIATKMKHGDYDHILKPLREKVKEQMRRGRK